MPNDDPSVTKRLLSPSNMDKSVIENEMENNTNKTEADLRLHDAVYDPENIEEIEELLAENEDLVFERDDEGRTPLHTLALAGDEEAPDIAKLLLGVSELNDGKSLSRPGLLDLIDSKGFTALHYAARNWQPTLVISLLKFGANPNLQDVKGNLPLHYAVEGNTDNALECVTEILKYNKLPEFMVNSKNKDELTPLHMAIKDQAVNIVPLLLKPENKFNLSVQNKLGQSVLHYICLEPGETTKTCEIMKGIVECCNAQQLNLLDNNERTALHIAAIERLPRFTKILINDKRVDVLKTDARKLRTALHYATENGCYPKGHECVEALISREFTESRDLIRYLYEMKDEMGNTPFMYACLNCPTPTLQKYLSIIPKPQFWMTETSMLLIYKQSPLSIKALMDRAFSERKKTKDQDVIFADFGPVTGYLDPVEKLSQQETKYLKQGMFWEYETQKEIMLHPLIQSFIVKKWKMLRTIIITWICWQLIWLTAYTLLAMTTYSGGIDSPIVATVAVFIMIVYVVASVINELFEMVAIGLPYFLSVTNWSQIIQNVLAIGATIPVFVGSAPGVWNKHAAAMGILLAYILSMKDIGKLHNMIGLVVEVLKQVVIQILQVLLCCSPLLVGFTMAFIILFDNEESLNTAFPGPLVKVLVMMTGEFEYNETFNGEDEKNATTTYRFVRLVFFLSFLIAVPVAFFNLLTGFALDKVMELRERAKVGRIVKQLEHIYFIESILLSLRPLRKICSHEKIVNWLRKRNVTTAFIDGKLQFETILEEDTRKKLDRRTLKDRRLDFWKTELRICGSELPTEVRNEIYALASSVSSKETHACVCICKCNKCV